MFPLHTWTFCLCSMVTDMPQLRDNAFHKPVATNGILSSQWDHNILCDGAPIMHMLCGVLTPERSWQLFYLTEVVLQFTDSNSRTVFRTPSCLVYWLLMICWYSRILHTDSPGCMCARFSTLCWFNASFPWTSAADTFLACRNQITA